MILRISYLLSLAILIGAIPCNAQTGTGKVTFYSVGSSAKEQIKVAVVPVGTAPFTGWLFDGDRKLVHAQRGRFMTFTFPKGEHRFSVPYHSSGPGKDSLVLTVEDGGRYCLRLSAKYKSASILAPVAFVNSQINQVPCQQAQKEAGTYKRVDLKRVEPSARAEFDQGPSFPIEN